MVRLKRSLRITIICSLGVFLAVPINFVYSGFALSTLWAWHLVPAGAPPIDTISAAIAIVAARFLTAGGRKYAEEDDPLSTLGRAIGVAVFCPTLALAVGWLAL